MIFTLSFFAIAESKESGQTPTVVPLNEYIKMLREYYKGKGVNLEPDKEISKAPTMGEKKKAADNWLNGLNEAGRFQALNVFDGKAVLILDTKLGHLWIWALPSVIYGGRVFPGEKVGEEILSIPAP
jgi:hypothetical protein